MVSANSRPRGWTPPPTALGPLAGEVLLETGEEYIHVRYRDPDRYETIRTPDWAAEAARSVSEVRTGKREDEWEVQSVLIEKGVGEETAREQAEEIVETIGEG